MGVKVDFISLLPWYSEARPPQYQCRVYLGVSDPVRPSQRFDLGRQHHSQDRVCQVKVGAPTNGAHDEGKGEE